MQMTVKQYEDLDITDNFIFYKVMSTRPDITRRVLELILNTKIKKLTILNGENVIQVAPDAKGSRLDVYIETEDGRIIDLEMQTSLLKEIPKRMRYYQSNIDLFNLNPNMRYEDLPENIVIFIVPKDPYNRGFYKYTFENRCTDDLALPFGDETKKIFINIAGDISGAPKEMQFFIRYLRKEAAMSTLTKDIDDAIVESRKNTRWKLEYMSWNAQRDDLLSEGYANGFKEGREDGLKEGQETLIASINNVMNTLKYDADQAMELLDIPKDQRDIDRKSVV